MAENQTRDYNAEQPADHGNLSGGTQGLGASRHAVTHKEEDEDTRDTTAPSGGVHPSGPPAGQRGNTGSGA